jgi:selenocysteine lyase/cysteine desulfurase
VAIDVDRARAETPGCAHVTHLNNAGSALPPAAVVDAVVDYLRREAQIGGYEAADERRESWEHTYDALARLVGGARDEIAVVENATRAWDMAFYAFRFGPGDRILTGRAEYASNWIALQQVARRTGAVVEVVPDDEHGQFDVESLGKMLDGRVKLVSLVHAPAHSGLINPVAEVGRLTRAAGVPLLLDACQSVGQLPIDVEALGCDVLSATARKFLRGPRGTGFLWVREALIEELEPPLLDLHAADWLPGGGYRIRADARRFENWETYYAGKASRLRRGLADLERVEVHDRGVVLGATATFTVEGRTAAEVKAALASARINVSVSPASYARLQLEDGGVPRLVRASAHYYNTEDELDRLVEVVASI